MATHPQRAVSIFTGAFNVAPTPTQQDRMARAFSASLPPDATTAQIAEQMVKAVRLFLWEQVTSYETQAEKTAIQESKAIQVPLDFPEAP